MRLNLRRTAAAAIILPVVLGAAACGKTETPSTGTTQSQSASSTATGNSSAQPFKDKDALVAALKAATDGATTAHVTMAMDASGEKISMVGDTKVDKTNPAMRVSMDMGSAMKLDMILVDGKVYMKGFPGLAANKWAVVDSSSTIGKQLADSLNQADPSKMYDQFDKAVTNVKYVGEDTVDGDKTYKYDLTLDSKSIEDTLPAEEKGKLPKTLSYTVWVDEKDHLRKVVFSLMGVDAEMTMSKYGEPVDIQAPPAKDTVKAPM
ncbi:LppX_LprAFG lipoprotein [Monashia sp. NPDC004114]